jgi:hypothetical protein
MFTLVFLGLLLLAVAGWTVQGIRSVRLVGSPATA